MTRIAIAGLGGVAERIHIPACRAVAGVEIAGACETHEETRRRMAGKFGLRAVYPDAVTLLDREKPDAVMIGTPPDSHHDLCLAALEHGAHVFCEKPFMRTLEEADRVIACARERNLVIAVNNQYRYMPIYRRTRERLARGDFGRLYFIQCWQQMFHPPSVEKVPWRAALRRSTLYEFGTHALDLICFFFDALPEALTANIPRAHPAYTSDVLVQMTLRFPEDRLATVALNRISQAPERYLEMRLDCEKASLRLSLGGVARAAIEWSSRAGRPVARLSFVRGGEARAESGGRSVCYVRERRPAFASATATHLSRFVDDIRSGVRSYDAVMHAREVLHLALTGYEAAASGETVWLR
ncbi:MAG TPA: Gfo/Idh/MocA family oxidoreductase [Methylomirabilota bacterium]|nr:Gfo/Idh/MocA family oxidoreductase [Methylomirabilota bacterium]